MTDEEAIDRAAIKLANRQAQEWEAIPLALQKIHIANVRAILAPHLAEAAELRAEIDRLTEALNSSATPRRWRHLKRGSEYVEIGRATLQSKTQDLMNGDRLVVYKGDHPDGQLWARGEDEFEDGRFVEIRAALQPKESK
jgi:hypothetical protein